jgi:hypothetical protein
MPQKRYLNQQQDRGAAGIRPVHLVLLLLMATLISLVLAGVASAGMPAGVVTGLPGQAKLQQAQVPVIQVTTAADPRADSAAGATITNIDVSEEHVLDMGKLGLRPIQGTPPMLPRPNGGAIGTQNAYMVASPDVVSQSTASALGTLLSGFTPGENIFYFLNAAQVATFTADTNGRLAVGISTAAGQGFLTFEGVGQTSGKRAGTVAQVLDSAPLVPGFASAPHALNTSAAAGTFLAYGFRFAPSQVVTLTRNSTVLGTATTNTAGRFFVSITPANNGDTSAIYTAVTTTLGSMSGSTVEERADAGTPPVGDMNLARAFVDRPVVSSAGGSVALSAEGFNPGETINISGCAAGSAPATANGALGAILTLPAGTANFNCVFTGATSGRVARASLASNPNVINAPSAINAPATLPLGAANTVFMFDRLQPNQSGTIFVDGVSRGPATTNASGFNSVIITAPLTLGIHNVAFVGSSGQVAVAPLYIVPSGGATPTATVTSGPATATVTATPCVGQSFFTETEPNNTLPTANSLPTTIGAEVRGGITPAGDVDYFSFQATAGDRIWAYINTSNAAPSTDSVLTLVNSLSQTLQLDDDNGSQSTLSSAIAGAPITQTGTYYLQVRQFGGATIMSPYSLYINRTSSATVLEVEPNDTFATANPYAFGTVVTGSIPITTDLDYFTFVIAQNDKVVIQVDGDPDRNGTNLVRTNQFNPNFDLLDGAGTQITAVDSESQGGFGGLLSENLVYTNTSAISTTFGVRIKFDPSAPPEDDLGIYNLHIYRITGVGCSPTPTVTSTPALPTATATCVPSGGSWTPGGNFPTTVVRGVGVYFPANGMFYEMGGRASDATGSDNTNPFEYNPATNTWVSRTVTYPDNQVNNMACGVLTVTGTPYIYCVGGSAAGQTTTTFRVFRYNPITNVITTAGIDPWNEATANTLPGGFTVFQNKLYILGGFTVNTAMTNRIYEFDPNRPAGSMWALKTAQLPVAMGYVPATTIGTLIYTAGGDIFTPPTTLSDTVNSYVYNPVGDSISPIASIPRATGETRAVNIGNKMWVLGGGRNAPNPSNQVDVYDPVAGTWSVGPPFNLVRRNFPADSDGSRIFIVGGYDNVGVGTPRNTTEVFTGGNPCPTSTVVVTNTPTRTVTATSTGVPPTSTTTATRTNTVPAATSTATNTPPAATGTSTSVPTVTNTPQGPPSTPTVTSTPCVITFTDVHPTDYFYEPVRYLWCAHVISGYDTVPPCDTGTPCFRPYANTTRGQMTKIVVLGFDVPLSTNTTPMFSDVPQSNPFFAYIQTAAENEIVSGYADGTFRPFNNVTRGQLSKIVVVAASIMLGWAIINPPDQTFSDVPPTNPFYTYIETAYCHGIISGYADGTFRWGADATRGQIAKIVYLAIQDQGACNPTAAPTNN